MQVYKVPYNFTHEEKVFGGYISIRQAIHLIMAAVTITIFFIPFIDVFFKSIIFFILSSMFIMFAFLKVEDTNADKYFIYVLRYALREKKYILEKGSE